MSRGPAGEEFRASQVDPVWRDPHTPWTPPSEQKPKRVKHVSSRRLSGRIRVWITARRRVRRLGRSSLRAGSGPGVCASLTEREEKSAIATASNEPFSGWTKIFTDPRLCAAIVDRLTFAGNILETGSTSYRLAHARTSRHLG